MSVPRCFRAAVLAAALLLVSFPAHAQPAGTHAEIMTVQLTSVDVVATDRDGNPVAGLEPADFEVYEDGKLQTVTNFSEFGSGADTVVVMPAGTAPREFPTARPPALIAFYFDETHLSTANRRLLFPAVRSFVSTRMREGDQGMVVTWNRELKVRIPWTSDLAALGREIDAMAAERPSSSPLQAERQRVERLLNKMAEEANQPENSLAPSWTELLNSARSYAESSRREVAQSAGAMVKLLNSLSGADGRKVVILATEYLPTVAGREIFEAVENIRAAAVVSSSTMAREARTGSAAADMTRYNLVSSLEVLGRVANAAGVTLYGINPVGVSGPASGNADQQNPGEVSDGLASSDQALSGISLLADLTGGRALVGLPADRALDRVRRDLDAWYSLAYRSKPGAEPERKVEVRAIRPGVRVRSRSGVYHRSLEREMADRVTANHLQAKSTNDLGITLQADPITSEGGRRLLPVRVVIPVDTLTLLPDGQGNVTGGFSVFTCAGDGAGQASGVNVQSQALSFTREQAAQMKGRRIGFAIQVPIEKGRNDVSVGVVDHASLVRGFAVLKAPKGTPPLP